MQSVTTRIMGITVLLVALQAMLLYLMGQPLKSATHGIMLWAGEVHSPENSQQLSDWYTFSHVIHGLVFYFLLARLFPLMSPWKRFAVAVGIEVAWELFENTPMVIEHYRQQALAQGYVGDSVLNSLSDTVAMSIGFLIAHRAPLWVTISLALGMELFTGYWIHDGLVLNIIGFVWTPDFIAEWQNSA